MAEIKSAIEIAMEKTKSLRLSSEEREKIKEDEFQSRAHGLVNRFLEVDLHFREVDKELAKLLPEQRAQMEKIMLQVLAESLDLDRKNDLVFQGIEILAPEKKKNIAKIKKLMEEYRSQKEREYQKTEKILRARLEAAGISGSAVLPKMEGSREWAEAVSAFRAPYEAELKALREEIKN